MQETETIDTEMPEEEVLMRQKLRVVILEGAKEFYDKHGNPTQCLTVNQVIDIVDKLTKDTASALNTLAP